MDVWSPWTSLFWAHLPAFVCPQPQKWRSAAQCSCYGSGCEGELGKIFHQISSWQNILNHLLWETVCECMLSLTKRWFLPSNLRALVKRTVRAGMLMPMANVSVANKAWKTGEKRRHWCVFITTSDNNYSYINSRRIEKGHMVNKRASHFLTSVWLPDGGLRPKHIEVCF